MQMSETQFRHALMEKAKQGQAVVRHRQPGCLVSLAALVHAASCTPCKREAQPSMGKGGCGAQQGGSPVIDRAFALLVTA